MFCMHLSFVSSDDNERENALTGETPRLTTVLRAAVAPPIGAIGEDMLERPPPPSARILLHPAVRSASLRWQKVDEASDERAQFLCVAANMQMQSSTPPTIAASGKQQARQVSIVPIGGSGANVRSKLSIDLPTIVRADRLRHPPPPPQQSPPPSPPAVVATTEKRQRRVSQTQQTIAAPPTKVATSASIRTEAPQRAALRRVTPPADDNDNDDNRAIGAAATHRSSKSPLSTRTATPMPPKRGAQQMAAANAADANEPREGDDKK